MNNDKIDASEQSRRVICPVYIFPQRAYRTSYRALERTFSDVTPRRSRIAIFLQKNVQLLTYIVRQARVTLSLSLCLSCDLTSFARAPQIYCRKFDERNAQSVSRRRCTWDRSRFCSRVTSRVSGPYPATRRGAARRPID